MNALKDGLNMTIYQMSQIETDWEIENYPSFLLSCGMTKASWEMLKIRLQTKILNARSNDAETFTISFLVIKSISHG